MTESKLLHKYRWSEFPDLVGCILMKQVKLFALISADETTYFTPEEDSRAMRKAESGQYEIYDTGPVMSALDEIHRRESGSKGPTWDFNPGVPQDFSQQKITLKCVTSPDSEQGMLGHGSSPEDPLDPMVITFSRIRVENITSMNQLEKEPIASGAEMALAPREKNAYLRLIGYMALKLKELDKLPIETPNKAGGTIEKDAHDLGYDIGKEESIGQKLEAALKVLEESRIPKSDSN